jgi:hypothetical protein
VRKHAILSLSVPLAALGCLAGHAAGYAIVGTSRQDAHIHGYLSFAPQFVAICAALVAVAAGLRLSGRLRGHPAAWPFALLAPIAFCAQELIERLVAGLPAHAVLEPAVLVGLVAQLPVAFVAYFAARALLRVTDAASRALRPTLAVTFAPVVLPAPRPSLTQAGTSLGFDRPGRAPPRS